MKMMAVVSLISITATATVTAIAECLLIIVWLLLHNFMFIVLWMLKSLFRNIQLHPNQTNAKTNKKFVSNLISENLMMEPSGTTRTTLLIQ